MKGRRKNEKHLDFIRQLPCVTCGNNIATEAAHIRRADGRIAKPITGNSIKPDDRYVVPLCGDCHQHGPQAQHKIGEHRFWYKRDPILLALELYSLSITRDFEQAEKAIEAFRSFCQW